MYEDEGTRGGVGRAEAARCGNGGKYIYIYVYIYTYTYIHIYIH